MSNDDERPQPDDDALPTSLGGAPLPISGLADDDDARDATDLVLVDPFAAPAITDVSLASPFLPAQDHTVAEAGAREVETRDAPTVVGAPSVDHTSHDGGALASPSVTGVTLYDVDLLSDDDGRSRSLADASPIPEISQTGAPLDDDDPLPLEPTPAALHRSGERVVEAPTRPVRRGRAAGLAIPVEFMLGGYQAHRRLGVGGMAEVFLARPPGGSRDVVLKRLIAHLSEDPRVTAMFRREARIASRLDHPNIVHILDFAEQQDSMFLVMEHLEGCDFRDLAYRWWATSRPLPIEPVVELIAQIARGLDYAHHAERAGPRERPGLVHRDISPENLFLTHEGVAKILDFGIAKPEGESDHLTKTGEVKGKIPYMSPEQVHGAPVDGRSDLWSLVVVLYWMLTGHRPFDGPNDFMTIKQIMETDPVPPAAVNDLVPTALDAVVLRGLAKDPDRRFARGQELHDTLMDLVHRLDKRKDTVRFAAEVAALDIPESEPVPYHPAAVPFARWPTP